MTPIDGSVCNVYNGMPAADLGEQGWESPWSGPNGGQCVQTKQLADGRVALRQSTDPAGPALIYTPEEITAFVAGVKRGLADHLTATHPHRTTPKGTG
ncbi:MULTISPECIES: DUF397 domain-containing protein [unclassified Streptomyces]|uniref:DUF397 domain-containing protein n=1 Tax=unclassified Streptomyces TaxID=2593676 RepID=UPI00224EA677|nr:MULTISPECIES: DUF397 domain-containing protein [unclassified Streptomyces]MCX4878788.1 DUF397 domain-containing protein [Streptomyces sp. NBC_00847]MCX5418752.1 DUF397 domain-containing protein [Streptomyces sp. NBC_00078]